MYDRKSIFQRPLKELSLLAILFLLSFALRFFLSRASPDISNDSCYYAFLGQNIFAGKGLTVNGHPALLIPPLYPFFIGLFMEGQLSMESSALFTSVLFGSLVPLSLYSLARAMGLEKKWALLSSFIAVFYWPLVEDSVKALPGSLFTCSLILAIGMGWKSSKVTKGYKEALWAGLLLGFAYLAREETVIFFALLLIFLGSLMIKEKRRKSWGIKTALFVVSFACLFGPRVLFLHEKSGQWLFSGKTASAAITGNLKFQHGDNPFPYEEAFYTPNPQLSQLWVSHPVTFDLSQYLFEQPAWLFRKYFTNLFAQIDSFYHLLQPGVIFFALLGLTMGLRTPGEERHREVFLLSMLLPSLSFPLIAISDRYIIPFTPLFIFWMVRGMEHTNKWMTENLFPSRRWTGAVFICFCLSLFLISWGDDILKEAFREKKLRESRLMGQWMRENLPDKEEEYCMARKSYINLFSGTKPFPLPYTRDVKALTDCMSHWKVKYLLADERYIKKLRPELVSLLDEKKKHDNLRAIYWLDEPRKIILYRLDHESKDEAGRSTEGL